MPLLTRSAAGSSGVLVVSANCLAGDAVGNAVKVTGPPVGGLYQVSTVDVTDPSALLTAAVITSKDTPTTCTIQLTGIVSGVYVGLTVGRTYFVSLAGVPVLTPPTAAPGGIAYVQPLGIALAADVLMLQPQPPVKRTGGP